MLANSKSALVVRCEYELQCATPSWSLSMLMVLSTKRGGYTDWPNGLTGNALNQVLHENTFHNGMIIVSYKKAGQYLRPGERP